MEERSRFYLATAIAMNVVTIWGFSQTYFAPLLSGQSAFGGSVSDLPLIVHVHGWSFFVWYLLLLWQVALISRSNHRLHRRTGVLSIALVALMTITGFIVIVVNIYKPLQPGAPPIWILFGPAILSTSLLFVVFYALALRNRKRPDRHKRYIVVASAPALGAAVFRILLTIFGPNMWNIPAGILLTNMFIIAGMAHDRRADGKVHGVYRIGLTACVIIELSFLALPHTAIGKVLLDSLAMIGRKLLFLYG